MEVPEGFHRHDHKPVCHHLLSAGREEVQGPARRLDQHVDPRLGHVIEPGPRQGQVRMAEGGCGGGLMLGEDLGVR